jgi:hypothetical protein
MENMIKEKSFQQYLKSGLNDKKMVELVGKNNLLSTITY